MRRLAHRLSVKLTSTNHEVVRARSISLVSAVGDGATLMQAGGPKAQTSRGQTAQALQADDAPRAGGLLPTSMLPFQSRLSSCSSMTQIVARSSSLNARPALGGDRVVAAAREAWTRPLCASLRRKARGLPLSVLGPPRPPAASPSPHPPERFTPCLSHRDVHLVDSLAVEAAAQLSVLGRAHLAAAAAAAVPVPAGPRAVVRLVSRRREPKPAVSAGPILRELADAVLLGPVLVLCALVGWCQRCRQGPPAVHLVRNLPQCRRRRERHQACTRLGYGRRRAQRDCSCLLG